MRRRQRIGFGHVLAGLVFLSLSQAQAAPRYSLVDILVFGADLTLDVTSYPPDIRELIREHKRRFESYVSKRAAPAGSSELSMVYQAQVRYERRLVAIATTPGHEAEAQQYVTDLAPCYEWEGFHDCPEQEARFAARYQATHPDGPFSQYLPLLEAHRWLCTAEGYDSEKSPAESARSRQSYDQALAVALRASSPSIRTAAAELQKRARCHVE